MRFPLLTDRLTIRPLELKDIDTFVAYRQDPEIAKFQSWEPSYSKIQALQLLESQVGVLVPKKDEWLQLGVCDRVTGELLGDLAIHSMAEDVSVFELGFTFARKNHGKGFAREAAMKLISCLMTEVGAKKIISQSDSRNIRSINLLLSLGFAHFPSRSWDEEFKGENVTVEHFEKS